MNWNNIGTNVKKLAGMLGRIFRIKTPTRSVGLENPREAELVQSSCRPEQREKMMREIETKKSRAMKWIKR